jgi:3-hydroxyisobutyrate dehydrogenase
MAKNLRQKISPSDTLFIQDVNPSATKRFAAEFANDYDVQIVETVKEVAEKSVSHFTTLSLSDFEHPMMNLYFPFPCMI